MIQKLFSCRATKLDAVAESHIAVILSERASAAEITITDIYESDRDECKRTERAGEGSYDAVAELIRQQSEVTEANLRSLVETYILAQGNGAASADKPFQEGVYRAALAKQLISENGIFGVKEVSNRIAGLAIALSGGDTSKLEELKAAIDKGFIQAADAFGGTLPDICGETYDEVMRKLDEWKAEADGIYTVG